MGEGLVEANQAILAFSILVHQMYSDVHTLQNLFEKYCKQFASSYQQLSVLLNQCLMVGHICDKASK